MTATQALRYNEWKPQWSLVDFGSLEPIVRGLEYWAKKYAPRNWTKGFPREKLLESMMRHMIALMDWEEVDPESGVPHIGLIQCNAMFYAYHSKRNSFITND